MTCTAQFLKNLQRFRVVTFDITDTLLRFRTEPATQYAETAAMLGIANIDKAHLQRCFRKEFKAMSERHSNFGCSSIGWQQWWIQLVENIFVCVQPTIPPERLRILAETLLQLYRTRDCWMHIESGKELLEKVRAAGKNVGVISNFDPSLSKVLREMELEEKFDFIITSYETGVLKPNAKIFEIPLERCKVQAQEALHIGNIYEIDYMGARNSGWCSLLVAKPVKGAKRTINPTHVYGSLTELMHSLETTDIEW